LPLAAPPNDLAILNSFTHLIQELSMTPFAPSSSSWASRAKVGLALAFLVGQMPLQAAPQEPDPPDPKAADRAVVSTNKGKSPNKHRETKRGPSEPEKYPTKPQQQVRDLR
jgi:hypothetical protein